MEHADRFLRRFYIEKGMFGSLSVTFIFYRPPLTWTFFPVFWSSISPIIALDFPPLLSSFSSFLSLFPILSAPPSAVLLPPPPPPFSHLVIFYWKLKVKRSGISANLFSLTLFSSNELVSRGGRARAKKKTREVCSALKQRQGSSSRPSPSAERWGEGESRVTPDLTFFINSFVLSLSLFVGSVASIGLNGGKSLIKLPVPRKSWA